MLTLGRQLTSKGVRWQWRAITNRRPVPTATPYLATNYQVPKYRHLAANSLGLGLPPQIPKSNPTSSVCHRVLMIKTRPVRRLVLMMIRQAKVRPRRLRQLRNHMVRRYRVRFSRLQRSLREVRLLLPVRRLVLMMIQQAKVRSRRLRQLRNHVVRRYRVRFSRLQRSLREVRLLLSPRRDLAVLGVLL